MGSFLTVDKTRFIRELLDGGAKVTLITRPRRFGKSMAMSMLKYFFTLEGAEENRALFVGTDVEAAGECYMREQGQWPVVLVSLEDIKPLKYDSMVVRIAALMHYLYAEFRYLPDGELLAKDDRAYFKDILFERAKDAKLQLALRNLLRYLQQYHGKPVILLIDEYDVPIQASWAAENSYYNEAIAFMLDLVAWLMLKYRVVLNCESVRKGGVPHQHLTPLGLGRRIFVQSGQGFITGG